MNAEINFERKETQDGFATERIDVIHNSLLGTYSNSGEYIITGNILNELLSLKKYITYQFGNSIYCSAFIKDKKQLDFEVVFSENKKKDVMISELYLLESVNKVNGYYSNTVRTVVANFEDTSDNGFVDTTKKFYNILGTFNDGEMEIDESVFSDEKDIMGIITKIELNGLLLNTLKDVHEKDFETIFKSKLKALKQKNNIFGEKVLAEFNSEYSKIERHFFVDEKGKVRYKGLSELLDKCVEMISGTDFSYAAGEQQYRDLISKEDNLRIQNSLQNEEKAMTAIAAQSLNNGDKHMQTTLAGISAASKPTIIEMVKLGEGDKAYPYIELKTVDSFRKQKQEQTDRLQHFDQSDRLETKKGLEASDKLMSRDEKSKTGKTLAGAKQQIDSAVKPEAKQGVQATGGVESEIENVEKVKSKRVKVKAFGENFADAMHSLTAGDYGERIFNDKASSDKSKDYGFDEAINIKAKENESSQDNKDLYETQFNTFTGASSDGEKSDKQKNNEDTFEDLISFGHKTHENDYTRER